MQLDKGSLVSPTLRLLNELGQGGMGSVWAAEHLTLHTRVAVKFVSAELAKNPESLTRFSREATVAAQLKHPHAVQVLDHGVSPEGLPFIAMELLEGEDLRKRLQRVGALPLQQTVVLVDQLCRALQKAHSLGLVHRDIKPDNIFLTEVDGDDFVKVLDFGVAKQQGWEGNRPTVTGSVFGTPHYMSPEQVVSTRDVDPHADLWSVAVVAYECLTGRSPFQGETPGAVFIAVERGVFPPPSTINPTLPRTMDVWFAKALAREKRERFTSAKELAATFCAAAQDPQAIGPGNVAFGVRIQDNSSSALSVPDLRSDVLVEPRTLPFNKRRTVSPLRLALVMGGAAVAALILAIVMFAGSRTPTPTVPDSVAATRSAQVTAKASSEAPQVPVTATSAAPDITVEEPVPTAVTSVNGKKPISATTANGTTQGKVPPTSTTTKKPQKDYGL